LVSYTDASKVANAARNIEIKQGLTATMTPTDATQFIEEADQVINSKLSACFYTPLRQITRDTVVKFPDPIPYIATRVAAALMVRSVYSRIEPRVSENADAHLKDALMELDELANGALVGSRRLDGQTLKARNFFVNPQVAPLEPPQQRI
jgi:hypothetical protein